MDFKRILVFMGLLLVIVITTSAQQKTKKNYWHEVGVGVGFAKSADNRFADFKGYIERKYRVGEHAQNVNSLELRGIKSIYYFYHLNKRIALGGVFGVTSSTHTYDDVHTPERYYDKQKSKISQKSYYMIPEMKWTWTDGRIARLYMKGGFGFYIQNQEFVSDFYESEVTKNENKTICMPTYQITPLGIELGRGKLNVFMELGYGMNGIFNIGFNYRFKQKYN